MATTGGFTATGLANVGFAAAATATALIGGSVVGSVGVAGAAAGAVAGAVADAVAAAGDITAGAVCSEAAVAFGRLHGLETTRRAGTAVGEKGNRRGQGLACPACWQPGQPHSNARIEASAWPIVPKATPWSDGWYCRLSSERKLCNWSSSERTLIADDQPAYGVEDLSSALWVWSMSRHTVQRMPTRTIDACGKGVHTSTAGGSAGYSSGKVRTRWQGVSSASHRF